ncbi:adenosylcobinamide-phosphate synthase CbiB [Metabacillus arenae]|uniref:Cobalamin biosynthesis protein CobD n=1 Tax=Metabacillus arenae TaxID=2771434 RepID=A0A926RVQ0_9BACI|nr:adenosylcobinamide-phosphate synthase CbiB [Metabacillus arenae]MBD1378710.1 cobalamin biosynthesis protein CobD [Metabacillus arenae]
MTVHLTAITIAFLLDLLIGDPKNMPHPVKWFGTSIVFLEKKLNIGEKRKRNGVILVVLLIFIVCTVTILLQLFFYSIHIYLGILFEALVIFTTIAQKSLKEAAMEVYYPLVKKDLKASREALSFIVGRDTEHLQEEEITRGAVETVAENTNDGITAPLFWAFVGGAPLAILYRLVNTLDSMVGYRNERYNQFGWASARLDDLLNWIPARLTGFIMVLSGKGVQSLWSCLRILVRDAKKHPSPNSGWGEAAMAALLGVQLGGTNYYKGIRSDRAKMGNHLQPLRAEHIGSACDLMKVTAAVFLIACWIGGLLIEFTISRI